MSIQWFPGHMNPARQEAGKTARAIDVIIEVVDARIPEASSNPFIKDLQRQSKRPCLKVLNKADLADPIATKAWLNFFNSELNLKTIALSGNRRNQVVKVTDLCQVLAPHRNSQAKPLRMLILGIPNVGKSTLLNSILQRRISRVGNEPAVTKEQQRYTLNNRMVLIDSPGLMWPKIQNPNVGYLLAAIHAIGANAVIDEEVAEFLADILLARYPELLASRYALKAERITGMSILESIAMKRGCRRKGKGGEFDMKKAARILLAEFRTGKLGRVSLEVPTERSA